MEQPMYSWAHMPKAPKQPRWQEWADRDGLDKLVWATVLCGLVAVAWLLAMYNAAQGGI